MEQKLQASISKYRETIRRITDSHRKTQTLPDHLREHPVAQGKRMRLEEINPRSITPPDNTNVEMTPTSKIKHTISYIGLGGRVTLHGDSMERLAEGCFLNDEIVNIMIQVAHDKLPEAKRVQVQLCDSYMYAQLTRGLEYKGQAEFKEELEKNVDRVNRYRRNRGPGGKPVTLMPICEEQHWFLLVIFVNGEPPNMKALIGVVDSLPSKPRTRATNVVSCYLQRTMGPLGIEIETWPVTVQENMYDCGVHLVHNATRLIELLGEESQICSNEVTARLNATPCPISRNEIRQNLEQLAARADSHGTINIPKDEKAGTKTVGIHPATKPMDGRLHNANDVRNEETRKGEKLSRDPLLVSKGEEVKLSNTISLYNNDNDPWVVTAATIQHLLEETNRARQKQATSSTKRCRFAKNIGADRLCFKQGTRSMAIMRLAGKKNIYIGEEQ